jgi:hypothetical protein
MRTAMRNVMMGAALVMSTVGLGMVAAAPAQAATSDCPSGRSCTWKDSSYVTDGRGGDRLAFQQNLVNFGNGYFYSVGASGFYNNANDSASSVFNNGNSCRSAYYKDAGYGTLAFSLATKVGDANLGNNVGQAPGGWNDNLSSGQFVC